VLRAAAVVQIMCLVYPIGIPLSWAYLLWRDRQAITVSKSQRLSGSGSPDFVSSALLAESSSFLWSPYKPKFFYWECVECGRRLLLSGERATVLATFCCSASHA
jgi:hypothetical protein